jgi:geranylgeranyl pyrophosphate synthase
VNRGLSIDARWYAPLVRPVLPTVRSALAEVDAPDDPWAVPRTGLGGAVVIHVAKEFGMRRWRRAGKVAVVALEGYNQRVHRDEPSPEERAEWLERDFGWIRRVWSSVLEHDGLVLGRVMDRLLGDKHGIADSRVPEAVLFLRSAVAAGVVAGAVPDAVHAALDRHATWLGLAWEANQGTLCPDAWHGALLGVDEDQPFPDDPDGHARERAREALTGLPERPIVPVLAALLAQVPSEPPHDRNPEAWTPSLAPAPRDGGYRGMGTSSDSDDDLASFSDAWCPRIDRALDAVVTSNSTALGSATRYLVGQGGKRVRPLVTLAAAQSVGGEPEAALRLAAAIEWIHQGSLVLDDIVDQAPLRRGAAPLHEATSTPFAAGVAIFVLARVLRTIDGIDPQARRRIVDAGSTLVTGEQLELRYTGDASLSLTKYYRVIEAKTARLFAAAAAVGGLAAGASGRQVRALTRFGREIGLAFQITDDLLDYVGDEQRLGKRPGTDLRAAKMTLPLIFLRDELDDDKRAWLGDCLGREEALEAINSALASHGIVERCRARADEHRARAIEALGCLPNDTGRALLAELGTRVAERRR